MMVSNNSSRLSGVSKLVRGTRRLVTVIGTPTTAWLRLIKLVYKDCIEGSWTIYDDPLTEGERATSVNGTSERMADE